MIGANEYAAVSTSDGGGDGDGGCLFTASHGTSGPVDPMLPALVITAAMFSALSRAGFRRRQAVSVR